MKIKSTLARLTEKLAKAKGNPSLLAREDELLESIETLEAEHAELGAEAKAISDQMETETPRYSNPQHNQRELAPSFVTGETFPPKDLDLKEAVGALLVLAFTDQRRDVLKQRHAAKAAERGAIETKLAAARTELATVQSQIA